MANELSPIQLSELSGNHFNLAQIDLIKASIMPPNSSNAELAYFLTIAGRAKLDPFAKQIYAIRRKVKIGKVWGDRVSAEVSIDGLRLIADRTGKYEGPVGPQWLRPCRKCKGEGIDDNGTCPACKGECGQWVDVWTGKVPPVAARVGVRKAGYKDVCWGIATWDSFAQKFKNHDTGEEYVGEQWKKMGDHMLAKTAEALALRKAFPSESSGLYTQDEIDAGGEQQRMTVDARVVERPSPTNGSEDDDDQEQDDERESKPMLKLPLANVREVEDSAVDAGFNVILGVPGADLFTTMHRDLIEGVAHDTVITGELKKAIFEAVCQRLGGDLGATQAAWRKAGVETLKGPITLSQLRLFVVEAATTINEFHGSKRAANKPEAAAAVDESAYRKGGGEDPPKTEPKPSPEAAPKTEPKAPETPKAPSEAAAADASEKPKRKKKKDVDGQVVPPTTTATSTSPEPAAAPKAEQEVAAPKPTEPAPAKPAETATTQAQPPIDQEQLQVSIGLVFAKAVDPKHKAVAEVLATAPNDADLLEDSKKVDLNGWCFALLSAGETAEVGILETRECWAAAGVTKVKGAKISVGEARRFVIAVSKKCVAKIAQLATAASK